MSQIEVTPLSVRPLHVLDGFNRGVGHWWACEYPERPRDIDCTFYDHRCRACALAAWADIATNGIRSGRERVYIGPADSGTWIGCDIADELRSALSDLHGIEVRA